MKLTEEHRKKIILLGGTINGDEFGGGNLKGFSDLINYVEFILDQYATRRTAKVGVDGRMEITNEELREIETLRENKKNPTRYFSQEEYNRLKYLVWKQWNQPISPPTALRTAGAGVKDLIRQLLLFCEPDGEVVNGFRTKEIIQALRTTAIPPLPEPPKNSEDE